MGFIIGLLTAILVLDCIALIFLVLIQLPKKEAGLGLAFGGSAADALFGAGSGTVLTKATKYAATLFFALAIVLGILQNHYHRRSQLEFQEGIEKQSQGVGIPLPPAAAPAPGQPAPSPSAPATQPAATPPAQPAPSAPAAEPQPPPQ